MVAVNDRVQRPVTLGLSDYRFGTVVEVYEANKSYVGQTSLFLAAVQWDGEDKPLRGYLADRLTIAESEHPSRRTILLKDVEEGRIIEARRR